MAQSGYTPILIYASGTTGTTPDAANLTSSASGAELALNYFDGKLFYKDSGGTVRVLATKGTGTIGGSNTQVQYNSSGALAGSANFTFNGTTVTMANDASISGLTVGKGAGAVSTNTAVGASALAANTSSGIANTAVGSGAGYSNTDGLRNTFVGRDSGRLNTTGSHLATLGESALYNNTTGSYNTGLGKEALASNTTASRNTAVGYQAGYTNATGQYNAYFGYTAGRIELQSGNTMIGDSAGYNTQSTSGYNTFIGQGSGSSITSGSKNTILGAYNGNQGGLNITTASNYIVLSDGDGNPKGFNDGGNWFLNTTATFIGSNNTTSSKASALSQSKNTNVTSGSAQTIYSSSVTGNNGSLVIVRGVDASFNWFADLVFYLNSNSATVITSAGGGSPGSRTYSVSSANLRLNPGTTQTTVVCTVIEGSVG